MKISINHLGFRPEDGSKRAVISGECEYDYFQIVDLGVEGYNEKHANPKTNRVVYSGPLKKKADEWGISHIADFSDFRIPGIYLITLGSEHNSTPFEIREDVYSRTLRKAFDYIHVQRCGQAVPGYHGPCHLDDAVVWETGEYIDTTGGWHDAGDLRKWVIHTLLLGITIVKLKRHKSPDWFSFDQIEGDLLNELRWGNAYFLKMQDKSGSIWHDVGGGLNGDNSDNRWTDNNIRSGDERHLNKKYLPVIQWRFILFEAMLAGLFREIDPEYSALCHAAAMRAYDFVKSEPVVQTNVAAWAVMALLELCSLAPERGFRGRLEAEVTNLLSLQETGFKFGQSKIRGYWYSNKDKMDFFRWHEGSGAPIIALCETSAFLGKEHPLTGKCLDALKLFCNDYILPLADTNPYGMIPFGLYANEPSMEKYRSLEGCLKFRFFSPTKCGFYQGLTAHLLSHAVGLTMAGKLLGDKTIEDTARRQAEWVMGCNP